MLAEADAKVSWNITLIQGSYNPVASAPPPPPTTGSQVCDYYLGRNGLNDHAADNTPTTYRMPFTWWERYKGL